MRCTLTYYGYRLRFRFRFACGCNRDVGPIFEKFAYQYAGLGAKQRCNDHDELEVGRVVRTRGGPHGEIELGWWKKQDGTEIFLTWEPASHWVRVYDDTDGHHPVEWRETRFVKIADEDTIWALVGGGDLGGNRPETADDILCRIRDAASPGR